MKNYVLHVAQSINATDSGIPTLSPENVLSNSLNITYFLAGIIAVIVIIIGAIMYTSSAGNSGTLTKAKNMILYSLVGLVVIIVAFAITNFVVGKF